MCLLTQARSTWVMEPLSVLPFPGTELGLLRSHHAEGMVGAPKSFRGMVGCWGAPGRARGSRDSPILPWHLEWLSLELPQGEATVPRCGWGISTALSTSSRACQGTKHVEEHQVMPRAWGTWEVPQELILCASPSLSLCQSNTASPGAQAGAAQGEMEPAGERGAPHIPPDQQPCLVHHPA